MTVVVVEPPEPILDPATLRRLAPGLGQLSDDDLDILIGCAQQEVEPTESWVGRSFGKQTLELVLDRFPCGPVVLPFPPLISVVSVSYIDAAGNAQTMSDADFHVRYAGLACGVSPVDVWPSTACRPEAVRIRYVAGYEAGDPKLLPAKRAMALAVHALGSISREDLFLRREKTDGISEREWTVSTVASELISTAVERLLRPFWVPR